MSTIIEQIKTGLDRLWECKQCHRLITNDENLAYHLVDRTLYGWCQTCFTRRNKSRNSVC